MDPFVITMVYGMNKLENRKPLWQHLLEVKQQIGENRWIITGDFNTIRHIEQRHGSSDYDFNTINDLIITLKRWLL